MRDFFRLLTVAVLSFALVGGALVHSRGSDPIAGIVETISAHTPIVQAAGSPVPRAPNAESQGATRLWIERPHHGAWMGIAGFPDQFDLRFPIPTGISYTGGTLELALDTHLAAGGDGRLTIQVNGTRRGEIVLNTGQQTHHVDIGLRPDELLGRELEVVLSGTGTTNSGQICPTNAANSGSAVTVLPSSGIALYTNDPANTVPIRLASLAEPIGLALGDTPNEQAAGIWAAQMLSRAGVKTAFASGETADIVLVSMGGNAVGVDTRGRIALGGEAGIDQLVAARATLLSAQPPPHGWPVTAKALGAETTVKNFRGSRRWSLSYELADLLHGHMPTALNLELKTSVLTEGNDWVVRLSLNGNLLETQRFAGTSEVISMPVVLPFEMQGLSNDITVELIDTTPNDSICRAGPDAQAQLLPSTTLESLGNQPSQGWGAMVRALANADNVGIVVESELTSIEAMEARSMLAAFLPARTKVVFGTAATEASVQMSILDAGELQTSLRIAERLSAETSGGSGTALVTSSLQWDAELALTDLADQRTQELVQALPATTAVILVSRNPA